MKILAIETSCDETALSFLEATGNLKTGPRFKVLANLISSQIEIHRPFGGVVPNLAKREHIKNLPLLLEKLKFEIKNSKLKIEDVDLIAVTVGPGLEPALWTGITFAQELAKKYKKPLVGANHLEGHLYSFLLQNKTRISNDKFRISKSIQDSKLEIKNYLPAIVLSVSGGHTMLLQLKKLGEAKKIGETLDDAVGEAFDKVARLLELPYPGGPEIERLAKLGDENAIDFPRPMMHHKNYDFSFSGLKTSVLYYLRDLKVSTNRQSLITNYYPNIAASFQKAAIEVLVHKTSKAAQEFEARSIIVVGGVSANKYLQKKLSSEAKKIGVNFFSPPKEFNTDNAAMIAAAAYINMLKSKPKKYKLEANSNISL